MVVRHFKKFVIAAVLMALALPAAAQGRRGRHMKQGNWTGMCRALIESTPAQALDGNEAEQLVYLAEEEKLARDVYAKLNEKWGVPVFRNISQSEQRHLDILKMLLDKYELSNPAANTGAGEFQDPGLQTLYADLISQGEASLSDALKVGAMVEELDIRDLQKAMAATDNEDLKIAFGNLQRGSENHLQAFIGRLEDLGASYPPQYLDAAEFSEILEASNTQAGNFMGRGKGRRGLGYGAGQCLRRRIQ
jgi:hypothetical protein